MKNLKTKFQRNINMIKTIKYDNNKAIESNEKRIIKETKK